MNCTNHDCEECRETKRLLGVISTYMTALDEIHSMTAWCTTQTEIPEDLLPRLRSLEAKIQIRIFDIIKRLIQPGPIKCTSGESSPSSSE